MLFIKRSILFLVTVSIVILSIAISGLNTEKVLVNLHFFSFEISLGFSLILTLFLGLLAGLFMALFSFHMPLKSQNRKLSRKNRELMSQKNQELTNND